MGYFSPYFGFYFGTSSEVGDSDVSDFGTRAGMEQKCNGAKNLELYEFQPANGVTRESLEGQAQIAGSIADDLEEANADMAVAWREFTDITLGYTKSYELRWLNDTAEYGGVVKAWAGRNVARAQSEDVPQQVATAMNEWERRLQMLRDGTALKDYYAEESDEDDSGILALQEGAGPVAKLSCLCPEAYDPDLYDCA